MGLRIIPSNTQIKFARFRNIAAAISAAAILASIGAFYVLGLNFGIDFTGGVEIEVEPQPGEEFGTDSLSAVRDAVAELGLGEVKVKTIGGTQTSPSGGISVTVPLPKDEEQGGEVDREAENRQTQIANQVKEILFETLGIGQEQVRKTDVVGPAVSGELIKAGVTAMVISIGLMLIYIWFRFEWQFSLGAILALVHDVIITVGVFSITQLDFTLSIIAALLTIIGYSMNDTVVVYDRIRENLRKFKKMPLHQLIDLSINQTLARTIMTSLTTLLALIALFLFGGDVLRGFSFALIWGIIIGTYSSVFIASPILLRTGVKRDWSEDGAGGKAVATNAP